MVEEGRDVVKPVRTPDTIVNALAIGDPADAVGAVETMTETGGWGTAPTDEETLAAVRLLAETEGVFAETGAAITVAAAKRLVAQGRLDPSGKDGATVLVLTGNGLKTQAAVAGTLPTPVQIGHRLIDFDANLSKLSRDLR